jgi:hypothetical protein
MSSLTGTSKLSASFEAAVRLMEQASGLCVGVGGGGGDGGDNVYVSGQCPSFLFISLPSPAVVLKTDVAAANVLLRDATSRARSVQRDSRVLLSLYVPNDHLFALYAP